MLNCTVRNRTVYMYTIDLAWNNLKSLMCHKTKPNRTKPKPYNQHIRVFILVQVFLTQILTNSIIIVKVVESK